MALQNIKKIKEKCKTCYKVFLKMPFSRSGMCVKCYKEAKEESEQIWYEILHDEIVYHD